jgi:enamine deaminase RidA (YjgF/YER057c/UK114 family)
VDSLSRNLISSGSAFESKIGYSRAVVEGDFVFVSGTTGYNYQNMRISESAVEQAEQCFINIQQTLEEAGCSIQSIVRVTYILPNRDDFESCWPVFKKW